MSEQKVMARVYHKKHKEYGVGNVYDVIMGTDMALVKFEDNDVFTNGIDPNFGMWVHLSMLEKAE